MKYYLFGNWKCNPTGLSEAKKLFFDTAKGIKKTETAEAAIFPPFCYLAEFAGKKKDLAVGAQHCGFKESGAYTGEVSLKQIADLGCKYVLLGHSERRKIFSETDSFVNQKAKLALSLNLIPVVCVGETDEERTAGRAIEVVKSQLELGLKDVDVKKILIAYEPVWAIGTGKACGFAEAREISRAIREIVGEETPVLYGGSANVQNGAVYLKEANYNGLLVGGVSLKADEFIKLFKVIEEIG
jgi:triosephosphate isomerase (TIM)